MNYFAGIDGGQSATVAVIGDEAGRILGRGGAGGADEVAQDSDSTRLRDALGGALADAAANAGLPVQTKYARIVAGVSGYDGRVYGKAPDLPAGALALLHDAPIAHAGAFAGGAGIAVIAGTGSVAYGVNGSGRQVTVGGWGFLFGDAGSGFWLARESLAGAMRDLDAGDRNDLGALALAYFQQPSLRALARAFYAGEIARMQLAAFASQIVEEGERGNERAAQYVGCAARSLATLAMQAQSHLAISAPKVAFIGGLTRNATVRDAIAQSMRELCPSCETVPARFDPATGALLLAYRAAGIAPPFGKERL